MAMPLIPFSIENKNTNHGAMEDKVDVVLLRVGDSNNSMIAFRHTTTMTKTVDVTMNNASIIILRGRKKKLRKKKRSMAFTVYMAKFEETSGRQLNASILFCE